MAFDGPLRKRVSTPLTSELFDQQDLVGVLPTQPVRTMDEHHLDVAGGRQVAYLFQSGPFESRPAIALVFEDPLLGHLQIERRGPLDQRRRLARDRVRFALSDSRTHACKSPPSACGRSIPWAATGRIRAGTSSE